MSEEAIAKAKEYFKGKYICSQSVLRAILEVKNCYFEEAPYISAGFGSGISRIGTVCGAVSGAIMAIGILEKEKFKEIEEHRNQTYKSVRNFLVKFKEKQSTIICNDLIGLDINNDNAREQASKNGVFTTICPTIIEIAVKLVLEMFPE